MQGRLFVISAPSGAGKTTLVNHVLSVFPDLAYSVSSTTRAPRAGETHGKDYFFITPDEFREKIDQGHWLEWAQVHDHYYGTSRGWVLSRLETGRSLILDIDVQGARQVMKSDLEPVTVFIQAPSFEILEKRLRGRGTDSPEVIEKRLQNAVDEMAHQDRYRYCVVNDDLGRARMEIEALFRRALEA